MHDNGSWPTLRRLLPMPNEELGRVDPVVMNLVVAKGLPALAGLDIGRYVRLADEWAADLLRGMALQEAEFRRTPGAWKNDLDFFRLGLVCRYVDLVLGMAYREDQRNLTQVYYTDPHDLFLSGIMDTRRGTCASMATLHVVLGRRIGLPVSLACAGSHLICRFDNGTKTINIEATDAGRGGFASPTDEELCAKHGLPQKAVRCGSDLRAVTPREMLGLFVGLRGRHLVDTKREAEAEPDCLLARYLFPQNRQLCYEQTGNMIVSGARLFEPDERGHPIALGRWLREAFCTTAALQNITPIPPPAQRKDQPHASNIDALFQQGFIGTNPIDFL